ncbi:Protein of unknown function [Pyronema omphalodes CBS 100304]|uniref:Uncharacterized protein n=1 Tax=Pyronema omphalodes (strain CBS 100304) TaxID=1076935 RepID=U4KVE8_PYROM|nr:Protein of unknown function [Pyronema omphalodes CBS 100304]
MPHGLLNVPNNMSNSMTGHMPGSMPENMFENMPGNMPVEMEGVQYMLGNIPISPSVHTPGLCNGKILPFEPGNLAVTVPYTDCEGCVRASGGKLIPNSRKISNAYRTHIFAPQPDTVYLQYSYCQFAFRGKCDTCDRSYCADHVALAIAEHGGNVEVCNSNVKAEWEALKTQMRYIFLTRYIMAPAVSTHERERIYQASVRIQSRTNELEGKGTEIATPLGFSAWCNSFKINVGMNVGMNADIKAEKY